MTTKEHAQLLAAGLAGHGVLNVCGLGIVIAVFAGVWTAVGGEVGEAMRQDGVPEEARTMMGAAMGFGLAIVTLIIAAEVALCFAGAWGLWNARRWAKVVCIIASALSVMSFPIGTLVGGYGFWFLLGERGKEWFPPPPGGSPAA